jgi:hypothetical protein
MLRPSLKWPTWLKVWILLSSVIVIWDAGFVFARPASMEGGLYTAAYPYAQVTSFGYGPLIPTTTRPTGPTLT